ncbi:YqgE/AlgH family protein [Thioalkalivibrio sp.]|uniref:YqgE/AlgH family protein n=1 Tax=Thioalkalivibrio sp. TaxID=2093813 RepID=UPI003562EF08
MALRTPDSTTDGLRNQFLIAMPSLQDGYFAQTVTYICEHTEEGAMGLVINQTLELTLKQMLRQLELQPTAETASRPIFRGGPVQPEHGFVLHPAGDEWSGTRKLGGDLALTTSRDILDSIARGEGPEHALIALGYAGWGPGQLESEIAENSWLVAPPGHAILFTLPPEQRWNAAARLIGIDMNLISQVAGHA